MPQAISKGEQTRQRIVAEAVRQGAVRGFASVSLADLAGRLGLSKSAVFKQFGSGEALQVAALKALVSDFMAAVWNPAERLPRGRTRLDAVFLAWLDWVDAGCGIIQAQIEYDDQPGPFRDLVAEQQARWNRVLTREFLAAGATNRDAAEQAAFEFCAIVLAYHQLRRLLDDPAARYRAIKAKDGLMARHARGANHA